MESRMKTRTITSKQSGCFINDILSSIIICFGLINGAIGYEGISYITISIVFVLCFLGLIKNSIRVNKYIIIITIYVLFVFLISYILHDYNCYYTTYYFMYFIGFGIVSLLVGSQTFSIKKVLKYVELIGFVCILIIAVRGFDDYDASIQMGIAYSFLPVLYASLINLKETRLKNLLSLINPIGIIWCYSSMAPRGIWLNVIITLSIYFFIMYGKDTTNYHIKKSRIIIMILLILFTTIVALYFEKIILFISNNVYKIMGVRIYALDKMIFLLNSGDLSNGRLELINMALDLSYNHLLFGRGIGFFELIQGEGGYVHNIVFQTIVEAGILFFIPFVILLIVSIKRLLSIANGIDYLEKSFYIMLLSNGFFVLFYSSVHWKLLLFWFFVGYLLNNRFNNLSVRRMICDI